MISMTSLLLEPIIDDNDDVQPRCTEFNAIEKFKSPLFANQKQQWLIRSTCLKRGGGSNPETVIVRMH